MAETMQSPYQPVDVLNRLMQLLGDLDAIEPNRFPMLIRNSKSASEVYAAILALGYAANSKELRDTGDDRVHSLCHAIWELVRDLDDVLRMQLLPASRSQAQTWEHTVIRKNELPYAFKENGALEVGMLDAELHGAMLRVKRIWGRYTNVGGSATDFVLKLEASQVAAYRYRRGSVELLRSAMEALTDTSND